MSTFLKNSRRILALDVHPKHYGYAVLETPTELLDWGVRRRYRQADSNDASMQKALRSLLALWKPSQVVVRESSHPKTRRLYRRLLGVVGETLPGCVPVRCFPETAMTGVLGGGKGLTNHAMAASLLEYFPYLASALPPERKPWQSEHYRMNMFVAAAIALAASRQPFKATSGVRQVRGHCNKPRT